MKAFFCLLFLMIICSQAGAKLQTYVGSTPPHAVVREFFRISLVDSIDFIRWKLEINSPRFKLVAKYGISKPGTPGFINEQSVAFEGQLNQSGYYYHLEHEGKVLSILEVNQNVLHLLDRNSNMLIGNGGYSFALNNINPIDTGAFNLKAKQSVTPNPQVFEGRTPCRDLAIQLGLEKNEDCNKMKWYILLYMDTLTGNPSYFMMGGIGYRKETMAKGSWQIITEQSGRILYRISFDGWARPLDLLKGDDNILFFIDTRGHLLSGDEDFSYTLNRKTEEYPRVKSN
ncbi:hypothetical protein DC498_23120 [Terrimonas sp.]|uniref:hypothetical protein n=1 Tax=Terrimonas sp. TaxID=1914338 RepID=UPI000D50E23C|nr:hypothetical protein [Terrimonas sp.]PVD49853.1 hypothetical protein DC498_23120 [Terrimonas sp.]